MGFAKQIEIEVQDLDGFDHLDYSLERDVESGAAAVVSCAVCAIEFVAFAPVTGFVVCVPCRRRVGITPIRR